MYLLNSYNDTVMIKPYDPYIITLLLLVAVIPGFYMLGYFGSKIITMFAIENRKAKYIGIALSIIGALFVLLLGYSGISMKQ